MSYKKYDITFQQRLSMEVEYDEGTADVKIYCTEERESFVKIYRGLTPIELTKVQRVFRNAESPRGLSSKLNCLRLVR